jgi:hypothetical protein
MEEHRNVGVEVNANDDLTDIPPQQPTPAQRLLKFRQQPSTFKKL